MYKILLVEDDETICRVLARQLEKWGYQVRCVTDFRCVLEDFTDFSPHLVLLDITLPFYNGYHWCEQLRRVSRTPILFVSSASDDRNQVMALSLGADDFLAKPFNLDVATAKIQAILRRTYAFGAEPNAECYGSVVLDVGEGKLTNGAFALELTRNETKILQMLLAARGAVVTREEIMRRLWDDESFVDDNTLTVNVTRLRRKLGGVELPALIATKKGVGYSAQV